MYDSRCPMCLCEVDAELEFNGDFVDGEKIRALCEECGYGFDITLHIDKDGNYSYEIS